MLETGVFWYGDNLEVMREHLTSDGEVDLIYLDPPFNSQRAYNSFMMEADSTISRAQLTAFEDYWRWGPESQKAYDEIRVPRRKHLVPASLVETMQMLRHVLGEGNMMAYLSMMAVRLVEMRRLLKPTGSIYLHCDSSASHYLKLLMDALFGVRSYRNDITWVRTNAHNFKSRIYPRVSDTILFYTWSGESDEYTWHTQRTSGYSEAQSKRFKADPDGRLYKAENLTMHGSSEERSRAWRGAKPKAGRVWGMSLEQREELLSAGRILTKRDGVTPRLDGWKIYLDETDGGKEVSCVWDDIPRIGNKDRERTGYPTQKPVALLERVISASSEEGQVVLDPFCGCGTAVIAAQKLKRKWIGIDVTHLAVSVLKRRMEMDFSGVTYRVRGEPEDPASARRLAADKPLEFQAWIVDAVGGIPVGAEKERKVAKGGGDDNRDGFVLFQDDPKAARSRRMLLSVKAGESYTNKPEIVDAIGGAMERHGATLGALLMSHEPSAGTYKRAASYGTWASETYSSSTRFPVIQIVVVDDIFMHGWRLQMPGENTSRKSQPPPGTPGASEELFDATGQPKQRAKPGVKKPSARPHVPEQTEIPDVPKTFRLTPKRSRK
jgi:site-specific DNA-methyltransferase (adenine-specific)